MLIIWLVLWSPGASAGTQITAAAKARAATPTTRARSSPRTQSFLYSSSRPALRAAASGDSPRAANDPTVAVKPAHPAASW